MQRNARSLLKFFPRYPFPRSPIPRSPSLPKIPAESPNHAISSFRPSLLDFPPHRPTQFGDCAGGIRGFCSGGLADHSKEVDEINLKFAEARDEIEAAMESKETVYFDEEALCAREAVKAVLGMFDGLLEKLAEKDRSALQRSMGLKIEQLKAELQQLDE